MIGPVSGTGRAMMASLQQAIQKGMPPDQAIQYVKSMATQGVAPLADLYAMMNQFQRLKQQPVQAPQTPPTIRDQLNMAEQQQAQQQMTMQQGLGGLPAPAMEQAQFAGGGIVAFNGEDGSLVNEPKFPSGQFFFPGAYEDSGEIKPWAAGIANAVSLRDSQFTVVRKAQALADQGRIQEAAALLRSVNIDPKRVLDKQVPTSPATSAPASAAPAPSSGANTPFTMEAFKGGGDNVLELMRDRELAAERERGRTSNIVPTTSRREVARPAAARTEAAPQGDMFSRFERTPPTLEAERAARLERQRAAKTGEFSQADEDLAAYIKEQKAQGGDTKEAYRNFWVMTGASLMANKSPNFLQALGESVRENYGGLVKDLKDLKDNTKSLRLQEIQLRRAREQAMESGSTADQERVDRLSEKADATNFAITTERNRINQNVLDRATNLRIAQLRMSNQNGSNDRINRLTALQDLVNEPGISAQEKAVRIEKLNNELEFQSRATAATVGTAYAADQSREARREAALVKARSSPAWVYGTPEAKAAIEQNMLITEGVDYPPQRANIGNPARVVDFNELK